MRYKTLKLAAVVLIILTMLLSIGCNSSSISPANSSENFNSRNEIKNDTDFENINAITPENSAEDTANNKPKKTPKPKKISESPILKEKKKLPNRKTTKRKKIDPRNRRRRRTPLKTPVPRPTLKRRSCPTGTKPCEDLCISQDDDCSY